MNTNSALELESDVLLQAPKATATNDDKCIDFCSRALKTCLAKHQCCDIDPRDPWLPTRLIDLHSSLLAKGIVRIIETGDLDEHDGPTRIQYMTLSHTWGQSFQPPKLLTSNIGQMKTGVVLLDLPRRFRETITLAERLKVRYLWIDSLW
jgi:hypothetical protein